MSLAQPSSLSLPPHTLSVARRPQRGPWNSAIRSFTDILWVRLLGVPADELLLERLSAAAGADDDAAGGTAACDGGTGTAAPWSRLKMEAPNGACGGASAGASSAASGMAGSCPGRERR